MNINGAGSFSAMQKISRSVQQLDSQNKASNNQTIRQIQATSSKTDAAAEKVINHAVTQKSIATETKGNMVDLLA